MHPEAFRTAVLDWFDLHGRKDFPWQWKRTPYRVWISEIMLQQTQVATVVPYFERFMSRFPNVEVLSAADLDEVLVFWAGLGYYARARNLHKAARCLMERYNGRFPQDLASLMSLPGIGRSTAGAILSFGMDRSAPILDGNIKRLLCRYAGLEGWPGESRTNRELWHLSETYTPGEKVAAYNQAMMDLGALVCTKRYPHCETCPLRDGCLSHCRGITDVIPMTKPRRTLPVRHCFMLVLRNAAGEVYLEKRAPAGLWGGLRSFPEFSSEGELLAWCSGRRIDTSRLECLRQRRHTFSHYHLDFTPVLVHTEQRYGFVGEGTGHGWFHPEALPGSPAPIQRLLVEINSVPN